MNSFLEDADKDIVVNNSKDRVTSVVTATESFELDVNFLRVPVAADRAERPVRCGAMSTRLRRRQARGGAPQGGACIAALCHHTPTTHTQLLFYYFFLITSVPLALASLLAPVSLDKRVFLRELTIEIR